MALHVLIDLYLHPLWHYAPRAVLDAPQVLQINRRLRKVASAVSSKSHALIGRHAIAEDLSRVCLIVVRDVLPNLREQTVHLEITAYSLIQKVQVWGIFWRQLCLHPINVKSISRLLLRILLSPQM